MLPLAPWFWLMLWLLWLIVFGLYIIYFKKSSSATSHPKGLDVLIIHPNNFLHSVMNIFVAKLNFNTKEERLSELFSQYGDVTSARIITDRMTRRSKGFGFVEMPDDEAAKRAIAELDGYEFEGRIIAVSEARPREERPAYGRGPRQ